MNNVLKHEYDTPEYWLAHVVNAIQQGLKLRNSGKFYHSFASEKFKTADKAMKYYFAKIK